MTKRRKVILAISICAIVIAALCILLSFIDMIPASFKIQGEGGEIYELSGIYSIFVIFWTSSFFKLIFVVSLVVYLVVIGVSIGAICYKKENSPFMMILSVFGVSMLILFIFMVVATFYAIPLM